MPKQERLATEDGRYIVKHGALKRNTNPGLDDSSRRKLIKKLMQARLSKNTEATLEAKTALGEAGAVWWSDGAPDYTGEHPAATPYASWWQSLTDADRERSS